MPDSVACAFLYAETALHAGEPAPSCFADLAIQRDESGLPVVLGSTLRGGLLAAAKKLRGKEEITWAFGSPPGSEVQQEGVLTFTPCRLLLFPVRTYKGVFAWITSPRLLSTWQSAVDQAGLNLALPSAPHPGEHEAFVARRSPVLTARQSVVIEDFSFPARQTDEVSALGEWFARNALSGGADCAYFQQRLSTGIVVLPDDACRFLIQHRVPVTRRVAIDPQTGTARDGALWSEEFLPSETLLYTLVGAEERGSVPPTPLNAVRWLKSLSLTRLQIGAHRTLGGGLVRWNWLNGE